MVWACIVSGFGYLLFMNGIFGGGGIELLVAGWVMVAVGLVLTTLARRRLRDHANLMGRRASGINKWLAIFMLVSPPALLAILIGVILSSGGITMGRPVRSDGRQCMNDPARTGAPTERVEPVGWLRRRTVVRLWAGATAMEDASVAAFEELRERLERLDAPAPLLARLDRAARDEGDHARRCLHIVERYDGARWELGSRPRGDTQTRSLKALCVEQLVDGCIGEAYAAKLAEAGSRTAADPEVAHALGVIADDEARHADDAWAVLTFLLPRASDEAQRALEETVVARSGRCPRARPAWTYAIDLERDGFVSRSDERRLYREVIAEVSGRLPLVSRAAPRSESLRRL